MDTDSEANDLRSSPSPEAERGRLARRAAKMAALQLLEAPAPIAKLQLTKHVWQLVFIRVYSCPSVVKKISAQSGGKMLKLSTTARTRLRGSPSRRMTVRVAYSAVTW